VLVLLFVILGPLGLPYLWKSPRFSQGAKVVLTLCVAWYTVFLARETVSVVHALQQGLGALPSPP